MAKLRFNNHSGLKSNRRTAYMGYRTSTREANYTSNVPTIRQKEYFEDIYRICVEAGIDVIPYEKLTCKDRAAVRNYIAYMNHKLTEKGICINEYRKKYSRYKFDKNTGEVIKVNAAGERIE